ncbi:PAS domain S-box protein [Fodinicurvata sp. EGI_FJ10296]|uniref:PAS domain S-box protein n=1 Tax=Fodinicurvata sp. EGI_FJ10296 TaxID=3231908 RepID=UPI003453019C
MTDRPTGGPVGGNNAPPVRKEGEDDRPFRRLFMRYAEPMWIYDVETLRFLDVNPAAVSRYGYSREEFLDMTLLDIRLPEDHEALLRSVAGAPDQTEKSGLWRHCGRDGRIRVVEITSHAITAEGRAARIVLVTDVTEQYLADPDYQETVGRRHADDALRQSSALASIAGQVARIGGWAHDIETDTIAWSGETCRLLGFPPALRPTRGDCLTLLSPEQQTVFDEDLRRCAARGVAFDRELDVATATGGALTVRCIGQARYDADGSITAVEGAVQDITEIKAGERAVRESRDRLRNIARATADLVWEWDIVNHSVWWSDGSSSLLGYRQNEMPASVDGWRSMIHPEDLFRVQDGFRETVTQGREHWGDEYRLRRSDGSYAYVMDRGFVMKDTAGTVVRIVGGMTDLTRRKEAELALARSNRALRMLTVCSEALIRAETESALLQRVCETAVEAGGYRTVCVAFAREDAASSVVPAVIAGADAGYLRRLSLSHAAGTPSGDGPVGRAIRFGEVQVVSDVTTDSTVPTAALATALGLRSGIILPLSDGQRPIGVLIVINGQAQEFIADEIRLLRTLADNLSFGIVSQRARLERARIQSAVETMAASVSSSADRTFFQRMAGSLAEALGAASGFVARLLPGDEGMAEVLGAMIDGAPAEAFTYSVVGSPCDAVTADHVTLIRSGVLSRFPEADLLPVFGADGYAGYRLDSAAGQPLGILFAVFREPIAQPDLVASTMRIFAARAAAELERREADARIREQASLLDKAQDAIVVRDLDRVVTYWNKGAERLYGIDRQAALGQPFDGLVGGVEAMLEQSTAALLADGEWRGTFVLDGGPGGHDRVVEGHASLVRDGDGEPESILLISTDVTDRHAMEEQLRQSQRLEAVGQLTGGVAHDFNNLLTVILGNIEILADRATEDARLWRVVDATRSAAERGAALTQRLLAFSRRQALEPAIIDVNALLSGMETLLGRTLSEDIAIDFRFARDIGRALIDEARLEAAVLNLCLNARDAMPGGGHLIIETRDAELDEAYASRHGDIDAGHYVAVSVSDTGVGIPDAVLEKVFDPFFTTKEVGRGSGLGLSMVYGFVKQSRGHIRVYSEVGQGTTVTLYLPRADDCVSAEPASGVAAEEKPGGSETVLLVEDDDLVRDHVHIQLESLGYRVVAAPSGPAALDILNGDAPVDLLFTDVVMPGGMNGPELAKRAAVLRPELKVLYTSGYTDTAMSLNGSLEPGVELLHKPYRRAELARRLRTALSRAPNGGATG